MIGLDGFLKNIALGNVESKKILFCTIPFINFKMMKIVLDTFDPIRLSQNSTKEQKCEIQAKIDQFNLIFLKGAVNQAIIAITALAVTILFSPVTLPGLFFYSGVSIILSAYTVSACASLIQYRYTGNFRVET